jgi:hypothetical protein
MGSNDQFCNGIAGWAWRTISNDMHLSLCNVPRNINVSLPQAANARSVAVI